MRGERSVVRPEVRDSGEGPVRRSPKGKKLKRYLMEFNHQVKTVWGGQSRARAAARCFFSPWQKQRAAARLPVVGAPGPGQSNVTALLVVGKVPTAAFACRTLCGVRLLPPSAEAAHRPARRTTSGTQRRPLVLCRQRTRGLLLWPGPGAPTTGRRTAARCHLLPGRKKHRAAARLASVRPTQSLPGEGLNSLRYLFRLFPLGSAWPVLHPNHEFQA